MKTTFKVVNPSLPTSSQFGRFSEVSAETATGMSQASMSMELQHESLWGEFSNQVEELLGFRIEGANAGPQVRRGGLRFPTRNLGSGEQRALDIIWQLKQGTAIVALEEPEFRLHPGLARRLPRVFQEFAPETQFIVVTHSSQMIDNVNINNNWVLSIHEGSTHAKRVAGNDDFQALLQQLGVLPSDLLLKDFFLFVEGGTESQAIAPAWAKTLGLDIGLDSNVGVLSIGGASRLKDNLRIWLEQSRHSATPWHVILDNHYAKTLRSLCQDLEIAQDKITVLSEHCIEDYYPTNLVSEGLHSIFNIADIDSAVLEPKPRDRIIERILQEHNLSTKGWKVNLALYIGSRMSSETIPGEFKEVVTMIKEQIEH